MSNQEQAPAPKQFAHESIAAAEQVAPLTVGQGELPWLSEPVELGAVLVTMRDETCPKFIVASAIGTNRRLTSAAEGMTDRQRENTDNMFWSRVSTFVRDGFHSRVETMPDPVTERPMHVMRNSGGQRVYFNIRRAEDGTPIVTRLGVCDKNRQSPVLKVLSSASDKAHHAKMSEN